MNSNTKPDLKSLMSDLRDWQLYVIRFEMAEPTDNVEAALAPVLHDHLLWLLDKEKCGVLLLSGPFVDETGYENFDGSGQAVIRASSLAEAERIAATEPFAKAGLRKNTVFGWRVNEGQITIKVNLLQGSVELD